jgi:hypothetical protein
MVSLFVPRSTNGTKPSSSIRWTSSLLACDLVSSVVVLTFGFLGCIAEAGTWKHRLLWFLISTLSSDVNLYSRTLRILVAYAFVYLLR